MKSKATYGLPERRFEMAYVTVPKDLTKIKSKVMFNLTKRQLLCFGAAVAIGLPLFFLTKDSAGTTTAALCMVLAMPPFRTSKFSPFREANRKVNFCRFFKGSRRFSAVQKLSVHPPIVYAVLRKFTAFWRKLWRKFCAHIRGWPQPVQTPFRRTHSCCGCRHPR